MGAYSVFLFIKLNYAKCISEQLTKYHNFKQEKKFDSLIDNRS